MHVLKTCVLVYDQILKYPRKTVTWWTSAWLNCYRRQHQAILKTVQTIWKIRIWAFRGALMASSSLFVGRDMRDLIPKTSSFCDFGKIVKTVVNQKRHNSGYDKARISHESSPKSSDSAFSDGLNSFKKCMMSGPVTVQLSTCPPCNSFSRIFQKLIYREPEPLVSTV